MSDSGAVLVITGTFDPTADLVIEELNRRAVPVFRADTAWFPSRLAVAAGLDGPDGWHGTVATGHRVLDLAAVRSVYYRWVFLEVNPNGQYGFVEQATGLPITAAVCDYLEGSST
ncbi:hypothetical protein ADK60_16060 [Streptomyces sp. XY431]|uniref:MvdC/MvdD family ATP grasp protein n=1 Tax=Streptomyces sp. XY431 TaxID=1415562 RepID=UPI0006ADAB14|nr:hypothetical protein [Streptomyces sp. XY431]KOV30841.1 hypothetical protein ADK60_16060 [Streptomyces sp. XY431]